MPVDKAPGNTEDGPGANPLRAVIERGKALVSEVEHLSEQHGTVYVRWSPDARLDLDGSHNSRDFVAGSEHSGLSAVEIDVDMHPVDIAKALSEYGFIRLQDRSNRPHVYLAERVGTDSDGHALIRPTKLLRDLDDADIKALDSNLAKIMDAEDDIALLEVRLAKFGNEPSVGRDVASAGLTKARETLSRLLPGDFLAPDSAGASSFDTFAKTMAEAAEPAQPRTQMTTAEADFLLSAAKPPDATGAAEAVAPARIEAIRAEYPDMMVSMDGQAPMRLDDFLAAAKAEADEMNADAPLMKAAAECALTFGV